MRAAREPNLPQPNPTVQLNSTPSAARAVPGCGERGARGDRSADKGVHEPPTPLFRGRDALPQSHTREPRQLPPPSATTQPRRPRPVRALGGQGLVRTPVQGLRRRAGGARRSVCLCVFVSLCVRACACVCARVSVCLYCARAGACVCVRAGAPVQEPLGVRACVMGLIPEQVAHWSWVARRLRSCLGVLLLIVSEAAAAAAAAAASQQLSGTAGRTVQKRAPFGESGGRVRGRRRKPVLVFGIIFPLLSLSLSFLRACVTPSK